MKLKWLTVLLLFILVACESNSGEEKNPPTQPEIILNGTSEMELELGTEFIDPGYVSDEVITTIGEVNVDVVGSYSLVYINEDGDSVSNRTVNVVDTVAPVIDISGSINVKLLEGSVFTLPEYSVFDLSSFEVVVEKNLNPFEVNEKQLVTVTAVDSSGNEASNTLEVEFVSPQKLGETVSSIDVLLQLDNTQLLVMSRMFGGKTLTNYADGEEVWKYSPINDSLFYRYLMGVFIDKNESVIALESTSSVSTNETKVQLVTLDDLGSIDNIREFDLIESDITYVGDIDLASIDSGYILTAEYTTLDEITFQEIKYLDMDYETVWSIVIEGEGFTIVDEEDDNITGRFTIPQISESGDYYTQQPYRLEFDLNGNYNSYEAPFEFTLYSFRNNRNEYVTYSELYQKYNYKTDGVETIHYIYEGEFDYAVIVSESNYISSRTDELTFEIVIKKISPEGDIIQEYSVNIDQQLSVGIVYVSGNTLYYTLGDWQSGYSLYMLTFGLEDIVVLD